MEIIVHCSPKAVARVGAALAFPVEDPAGGIMWEFPSWYAALFRAACEREQQFVENYSPAVTG